MLVCRQKAMAGEIVVGDAVAELARLQDTGVMLTTRSLQVGPHMRGACKPRASVGVVG
jgi:hypothetical protein